MDSPRMIGFPSEVATRVTLDNWQDSPSVRWAFRHMREIIPSQLIPAGPAATDISAGKPVDLTSVEVSRLGGATASVSEVIADTFTDALLVLHGGELVHEEYFSDFQPTTPHLLMSVSKSVVGCVAGILVGQGLLDVDSTVAGYIPELAGTGYGDATVRHLLDMRTGVLFRETYDLPESEVRVMERSMGWRTRLEGDPVGAYAYLATLTAPEPHGGTFTYRSADTDMLGWVCERASGQRMADLISSMLWQPLGAEMPAEITCDAVGSAIHDGGVSAIPRDLARFGQMLLNGGSVDGQQIVPAAWLADAHEPGAGVRAAFEASENEAVLPGGWYRNQFWFIPGHHSTALVCLGIHGQMVYVNPATKLVAVKLSSWPNPQDTHNLVDTLRSFSALGASLASPLIE